VIGLGSLCKTWGLWRQGVLGQEWGLEVMSPTPALTPPLPARPAPAHSFGGSDGSTVVKLILGQGLVQSSDPVLPTLIFLLPRNLALILTSLSMRSAVIKKRVPPPFFS